MSLYNKNTTYNYVNFFNFNFNSLELYRLYMPIISPNALKLFLHLCSDISSSNSFNLSQKFIDDLLSTINLSFDEFESAHKNLEAVGLLKTYLSKNRSEVFFDVISPLNYNDFIFNEKLKTLLINKIGKKEFDFLKIVFSQNQIPSFYEDISDNIDNYYDNYLDNTYEFNFDKLYENLSKTTSISVCIDENIKKLINEYFTSKKFTFEQIESYIYKSLLKDNSNDTFFVSYDVLMKQLSDNKKETIKKDFKKLLRINRCNDLFMKNTSLTLINKSYSNYSSFTSEQYLSLISSTELSENDIKIISSLREEYCLNDMLINIMIDYSLDKTHHVLNEKYLKKIARSFKLKNIDSLDKAYNHLCEWGNSNSKKTTRKTIEKDSSDEDKEIQKVNRDNISDNNSIDWTIFE